MTVYWTMHLLALSKRRPQGRDLFTEPYGRFFHLLRELTTRGHSADLLMLSHRNDPAAQRDAEGVCLISRSVLPLGPFGFVHQAREIVRQTKPDWIIGFSDMWYGILAQGLGKASSTHSLVDAYDNYESYFPRFKFAHALWRRALARADAVTAAGPQLAASMSEAANGRVVKIVPMAADPLFKPFDRTECRVRLGLPTNRVLVGYSGALHPNRGIELLFDIHAKLRQFLPGVELVLSGKLGPGVSLPLDVHWLGYRKWEEVPHILNSLDLLFILNTPSAFGNFSYPAKLYEAMRCRIPVVAADLPATAWVLREHPEFLAKPGSVDSFVAKATRALPLGRFDYGADSTWEESAQYLESVLHNT